MYSIFISNSIRFPLSIKSRVTFNTMMPEWKGRNFTVDIFKSIFIKIHQNFTGFSFQGLNDWYVVNISSGNGLLANVRQAITGSSCEKLNSSPPGQNGHHFADDIFRCILVVEKFCTLIKISLFVPKGQIDKNPALV